MAHQYTVNAVMLEGSVISIINDVAAIDRTLTCAAVLLVTGCTKTMGAFEKDFPKVIVFWVTPPAVSHVYDTAPEAKSAFVITLRQSDHPGYTVSLP